MWSYSDRNNSIFGKPDVFTENLSASHIAFEGGTWLIQNLAGPSPGGFFIAEGAASTNPGTLVGAGNFAPSACYRGNGDPQSDGNGRECQLLYNCYLEPDIVLEYTIGGLVENTTENWEDLPANVMGLIVEMGIVGAGFKHGSPFPPNAQTEFDYHGRLVSVTFHNVGDISGALTRLVLAGGDVRGDSFAVNVMQGQEKTNGAGFTVAIVKVPQVGKPDCIKFNNLASGIAGLLGTVAGELSKGVGTGLAAISGWLGLAATG
ncbi:hypothetical protein HK104_000473 [Borealophlyctis nickersoniae]|nr:hypothetical protein HK104_000473 [Borealophlyctis nickersoniae]